MRLTRRGRVVAAATLALWAFSLVSERPLAIDLALLLTLAFVLGLARLRAPVVAVERHLDRLRYVEGERVQERLVLSLSKPREATVEIAEAAPPALRRVDQETRATVRLTSAAPQTVEIEWETAAWGSMRLGPARLVVRDTFGLLEADVEAPGELAFIVRPRAEALAKYKAPASRPEPIAGGYSVSRPGDGGEFFGLREYMPGDSIRRINWKASARVGETIVNQVNRENFSRAIILVDLRGKEDLGDPAASAAVQNGRAAASILAHHSKQRDLLTVLAIGARPTKLSSTPNPRLDEVLDGLAGAPRGGDAPLGPMMREVLEHIRPRSPVYFCTSGAFDPTLADAVGLCASLGARPILLASQPPDLLAEGLDEAARETRTKALAAARATGARVIEWNDITHLGAALNAAQ